MAWVFDASVAATWCFDSEQTPETDALLNRLQNERATVPALFPLEIANVLTQALRRKPPRINEQKRSEFLAALSQAPLTIDDETNAHAWGETIAIADRHKLSLYDAAYLELAIRLGVELATLDDDLIKAAQAEGVPVIP